MNGRPTLHSYILRIYRFRKEQDIKANELIGTLQSTIDGESNASVFGTARELCEALESDLEKKLHESERNPDRTRNAENK